MNPRPDTPSRIDSASRPDRAGRAFVIISIFASLIAIGVMSIWVVGGAANNEVVLDVADATIDVTPSTVAPLDDQAPASTSTPILPDEPIAASGPGRSAPAQTPPLTTMPIGDDVEDDGLSPLADLLGPTYSVIPEPLVPRPQPVGLATSSIDVDDFPVRAVGLEDDGQLEVPDETEIGWYRYGATAGRPGATVLAAHVSWNNTTGPFFQLGSMEPGDEISVTLDDGTERQYLVTERTMYDKNELPRERIWRNSGDEQLVLITCGGDFNPEIRRYRQNIVVYASPVG